MAFGSFDRKTSSQPMAEINMVPLIDVVLVLLVIFIVTAPLLTNVVKLDLPKATSTADIQKPEKVEFAIDAAGALFWKRTEEVREQVKDVAAMIFLQAHLDRLAETLSHGQKQWLEIGMLLIQDPELLMLDEPVAGMSVSERAKTAELLKQIIKNRSVIVIEHDMKFVETIAHRVTVLHQGKVLAEGDMQSVQSNPKVKEVYLGH